MLLQSSIRAKRMRNISPFNGYKFKTKPVIPGPDKAVYVPKYDKPDYHITLQNMRASVNYVKDQDNVLEPFEKHLGETGFDQVGILCKREFENNKEFRKRKYGEGLESLVTYPWVGDRYWKARRRELGKPVFRDSQSTNIKPRVATQRYGTQERPGSLSSQQKSLRRARNPQIQETPKAMSKKVDLMNETRRSNIQKVGSIFRSKEKPFRNREEVIGLFDSIVLPKTTKEMNLRLGNSLSPSRGRRHRLKHERRSQDYSSKTPTEHRLAFPPKTKRSLSGHVDMSQFVEENSRGYYGFKRRTGNSIRQKSPRKPMNMSIGAFRAHNNRLRSTFASKKISQYRKSLRESKVKKLLSKYRDHLSFHKFLTLS